MVTLLPISFKPVVEAWKNSNKPALMTIMRNNNKWDRSNVFFEGGKLIEYNKSNINSNMKYIDYGLGVLSKQVFDSYGSNQSFDLADVYQALSVQRKLAGYEVDQRFYEIGSQAGLRDFEHFLSKEIRP